MAKETKVKRLNVYKVVTVIPGAEQNHPGLQQTDFVRAKSKVGAAALIAERYISAALATQDDLIKLAGVSVIESPK